MEKRRIANPTEEMSDAQCVAGIIAKLKSDPEEIQTVQHIAARKLLAFDGETYPSDGCAITLSCLLQDGGVDIHDTYQALALGNVLKKRGWQIIPVGEQRAGDVGSTIYGNTAHHGTDHIYFVVQALNTDEMVIVDNQAHTAHFRFASGKGKTPTRFFLRAPEA